MSLSTQVLLGLLAGIATGLFLGDLASPLAVVGRAFVLALQVTVLPFMSVALISGLGQLDAKSALAVARAGGVILLLLWLIVMAVVLAFPVAFPDWESASFFSRSLVEVPERVDFLNLYIPSNPFGSMADGIVPAIVVFSIAVGVALIGVESKAPLLQALDAFRLALDRVTGFVVRLAPVGVFALMASAAGTLDLAAFGRIQVYVLVYTGVALVLVFWVLPLLVSTLTPLTYRQVLGPVRDALVTAFATGNLLIILPILTDRGRGMLRDAGLDAGASDAAVDVLIPASFTIPNMGKLLSLAFVPFAGWFTGFDLAAAQYPVFAAVGFASFFGEPVVSLPFLLNLLRIPADTFQLFVSVDVITSRFGTLLAAVHTLVLAVLAGFVMQHALKIRWARLAIFAVSSTFLLAAVIVGARALFTYGMEPTYTGYRDFIQMEPILASVESRVLAEPPAPSADATVAGERLDLIRRRGALRVGYFANALPQAFRNANGRLVGFDIEMAHEIARELGVGLEFLEIARSDLAARLDDGSCDVVVSGTVITPDLASKVRQSTPVMDLTLALVVPDERREEFATWDAIRRQPRLRLGLGPSEYYRRQMATLLPDAEVVALDSHRDFFTGGTKVDALVTAAEVGAAWTLVYPRYAVAVPLPDRIAVPVGYAMPYGEPRLTEFVDTVIRLKAADGTTAKLFSHWYEGRSPTGQRRRWSIVHDVLGWVGE